MGRLEQQTSFNFLLGESGWRAKQREIYHQLQARYLHAPQTHARSAFTLHPEHTVVSIHAYINPVQQAAQDPDSVCLAVQRSWLTPVELFQPWYAQAVARYIVRDFVQRRPSHPLSIIEIGGGHGTMASGVLVCAHQAARQHVGLRPAMQI